MPASKPNNVVAIGIKASTLDMSESLLARKDVEFLTISEVAVILRASRITVFRMVERMAVPVYRPCRKILIRRTDLVRYLEESFTPALRKR